MKLRGRVLVGVTIAALAVVLAAPAAGKILVQRGIAGVRLGMTRKQVRAKLGAPRAVKKGRSPAGRYTRYAYPGLTIFFRGNRRVTAVYTKLRRERTPSGIGVGSTKKQLKAKIRRVRCRSTLGVNYCWVGALRPGRRLTTFYLHGNRIWRVAVGVVPG